MKALLSVVTFCLLSNFGLGQKLSEAGKFKMLNAYRKVVVAQQDRDARQQALCNADQACIEKQQKLGATVQEFQKLVDGEIKANNFPPGTKFDLSKTDADEISAILPEKKPEAKKPEAEKK